MRVRLFYMGSHRNTFVLDTCPLHVYYMASSWKQSFVADTHLLDSHLQVKDKATNILKMFIFLVYFICQLYYCVCSSSCSIQTGQFSSTCLESDTKGTYQRSTVACGNACLQSHNLCHGYIYDKNERTCKLLDNNNFTICTKHPSGSSRKSYIRVSKMQ